MEQTVRVNTGTAYDVSIGSGLLPRCGALLAAPCRVMVVTDSNVAPLYLSTVLDSLRAAGFSPASFTFPAGEPSKNLETLSALLEAMAEARLTRKDLAVALGGGVCGDLTGFAAGCYLRGIDFVQLPTTLLAAVDASVGGKTAVDLRAGKNLAGLFHQPRAVLCDTDTLKTLPPAVLADGVAEAIKTGILLGEPLFSLFENGDPKAFCSEIIVQCVRFKGRVVEQDEREQGLRKTLNLGHTAGHAVELLSGYTVSHGHAVAIGTAIVARAAARLGFCDEGTCRRIEQTLRRNALPTETSYPAAALAEAALGDKKRSGDDITLVIPERIGKCCLRELPIAELPDFFAAGLEG